MNRASVWLGADSYRDKYLVHLFLLVKSFYEGFKFLLDLTNFLCREANGGFVKRTESSANPKLAGNNFSNFKIVYPPLIKETTEVKVNILLGTRHTF